tara:strand:+ start:157 stop:483 length:327 start_codon:yes stop_codon:yes gene_type:complete
MAVFAKVLNGLVIDIIVSEQDFINNMTDTSPGNWIETFEDGRIRANYASKGGNYDPINDVFYSKRPHGFDSWVLNEDTWQWEAPEPYPSDDTVGYYWDEENKTWAKLR